MMSAVSVKERILDILFPPHAACASCGREAVVGEDELCEDCRMGLELFNNAPPPEHVDGYSSVYIYNDVSSRMVTRLKYGNARYIARILADAISVPEGWSFDAVVPVPIHYRRELKRGYNQSELIARRLCERLGLKLDSELLIKARATRSQARLTDAARKKNLKNAFAGDERCRGMSVLLIDDVRTTGATLSECAKELKSRGAERVYAITACCARER